MIQLVLGLEGVVLLLEVGGFGVLLIAFSVAVVIIVIMLLF